jgi:hypothetical protein
VTSIAGSGEPRARTDRSAGLLLAGSAVGVLLVSRTLNAMLHALKYAVWDGIAQWMDTFDYDPRTISSA